jgi:dolichol-phosphate mannosyltransferase
MVIGDGVIANRFLDYSLQSNYLIFAGSVNDSSIRDESLINIEEAAIQAALLQYTDATFVYFSSCSILDSNVSDSPYVKHKIRMEALVQRLANNFFIFRLPQILSLSDTKSSLVNFLIESIQKNTHFELWKNAEKNLIDIDDVHEIVSEVLNKKIYLNNIINVASSSNTSVLQLVTKIEQFLGVSGNYNLVNKGASCKIDISPITPILADLNLDFDEHYIYKSLCKYYDHLKKPSKLISVIVPTYNEEHGIEEFYRRTKNVLLKLTPRFNYEIIFVNDFSTDKTYQKLQSISNNDQSVKLINFSRNFGNQVAITAGIDFSKGDVVIVIDDDLQDPPEIILNFISKWDKGYKVVYGVRPNRQGVRPAFKFVAKWYYRLLGSLSDTKIPHDTGDFRLIDRVVVEELKKIKEENRYYRGLVAWVGFSQIGVLYERDKRFAGVSTFSFKKYVNFALNGLTSFTEKPLYFSSFLGLVITSFSFVAALILIAIKLLDPLITIQGWTSLTVVILFFGGVQLLSIGVLSIYISKIYREVKGRPLYIIESTENLRE